MSFNASFLAGAAALFGSCGRLRFLGGYWRDQSGEGETNDKESFHDKLPALSSFTTTSTVNVPLPRARSPSK
jgi:hypothetical protein